MSQVLAWATYDKIFYEGDDYSLHALNPQPLLSNAIFEPQVKLSDGAGATFLDDGNLLFREDAFDPVARVRRGRFYGTDSRRQRPTFYPKDRVAHFSEVASADSSPTIPFEVYRPIGLLRQKQELGKSLVKLGIYHHGSFSYTSTWRIVDVEEVGVMYVSELLFTLKAVSTFGVLPLLDEAKVPREALAEVKQAVETVLDTAYKYQAASIVDVCREAARTVLASWLSALGKDVRGKDLGALIKAVPDGNVAIESSAALINRLHPRGKSSEQEHQEEKGQKIRSLVNEDASLAIDLFGFLLREVGWVAE